MPPENVATSPAMTEFEAQSWPIEAAAEGLAAVIDGFAHGDTRPLVIGDGEQPVLVVLAIGDLADFRARVSQLLANPVDAGWLRYHLRSASSEMSPETLVELLGVDTDHGLTSLGSQVSVAQAAVLLPDHLRRAEEGANPLMLIGDGRMATAALVAFEAFAILLEMESDARDSESGDGEPDPIPTPLEALARQLGPVSSEIVVQINAEKESTEVVFDLTFEADLIAHLADLESRAQAAPGGGAYEELRATLRYLDELRSGGTDGVEDEAPYVDVGDLPAELVRVREHFRTGHDDPFLVGVGGQPMAGLVSYDLYLLLQEVSVTLGGSEDAPVLPVPGGDGPPILPFDVAREVAAAVLEDIAAGEGSMLFVADENGHAELVLAPLPWLWAYVDHVDPSDA